MLVFIVYVHLWMVVWIDYVLVVQAKKRTKKKVVVEEEASEDTIQYAKKISSMNATHGQY